MLLPTEDLENGCLRTLVADVIAETLLGNSIGGRACEGWFIWSSISRLVEAVKAQMAPKATGEEIEVDTRSRLEKFGLLSERGESTRPRLDGRRSLFSEVFWRVLQYGFLTIVTIRFVLVGIFASYLEPRRSSSNPKATATGLSPMTTGYETPIPPRLILNFKIFSFLSTVLDLGFRMPWLSGSLSLVKHHLIYGPLKIGATDGLLDQ